MAKVIERKLVHSGTVNQPQKVILLLKKFRLWLLGLLAIIIFYPPYLRGLYFADEQLPTEIFVFVVYIAFLVYKYMKKDRKFIETPLEYVSAGFVLVYFLSIFTAVSTRQAIGEWLKYCMFFAVFMMLSELLNTYHSRIFVLWTIVASALGVSFIGIDGVAGSKTVTVLNNLFKAMGSEIDVFHSIFVGNRINSTLQYPNATAAYLMAVFFVTVALSMVSGKTIARLISGLSSYIILIAFMLTLSRGAIVFLPIVAIAFVVLQGKGNRVKSILYLLPAVFAMMVTVTRLTNYMASPEGNAANVWLSVLAGMVIAAVLQIGVQLIYSFISTVKERGSRGYRVLKVQGYGFSAAAIILSMVGAVVVVTSDTSLVLSHAEGQGDSSLSVRRSFKLEAGKEYKLLYQVQAENNKMKPHAYTITVASRDFAGIINGKDSPVTSMAGKATKGFEQRELPFQVPANSSAMSITFSNYFEGTKAGFKEVKIIPADPAGKEQKVTVRYKFIPESMIARVDEAKETKSGVERIIFAKDGLKIFRDHVILGGGGGSWPLLYFSYQSYFYNTTQAHNYPVQVIVETGILGLVVLAGLYGAWLLAVIWSSRSGKSVSANESTLYAGLLAACMALLMHSCMDFDLSLMAIHLLLWQLLAIINSGIRSTGNTEGSQKMQWNMDRILYRVKPVHIHPAICIFVMSIIVIFPILFNEGLINLNKSIKMQIENNPSEAVKYMGKAVESDPFHAVYKADYINMVIQQGNKSVSQRDLQKVGKYALSIEKAAETNAEVAVKLGSYYWATSSVDKALYYFDKAIQLRPLCAEDWQSKAYVNYQLATYYKGKGDAASAEKHYREVLQISEEVKKVNSRSMIPFVMTSTTMELMEKVRIVQEKGTSLKESIASRSVFYNINDMDVDGNGIPDEWNDTNTRELVIQVSDNKLIAEAQSGRQGVLQSRQIYLQPEKTYVISVELENSKEVGELLVTISGQREPMKLMKNGSTYSKEISTDKDGNVEPVSLGIIVNGKYVIKDVRVVEK